MAATSFLGADGAPLQLHTSSVPDSSAGFGPELSPRAEIERLRAVIKTKDMCMFNFAKTLRAADAKALAAERQLQEVQDRRRGEDVSAEVERLRHELQEETGKNERLRLVNEKMGQLNRSREEALQGEIRQLALQLSATTANRADEMQQEIATWKAEVHSVLEQARRELAACQDENKILRSELQASEHSAKTHRESSEARTSEIQSLQYENKQVQSRLEQAEEELRQMARDANMSQSAFRANSSELESKVESLQLRTVWLEGLLSERERLHNESEEHRRNAEEMKAATEKLLAQAGQDLREAKESINEMHLQFEAYKESSLQVNTEIEDLRQQLAAAQAEVAEHKKNCNADTNDEARDNQPFQVVKAAQQIQRSGAPRPQAHDLEEHREEIADDILQVDFTTQIKALKQQLEEKEQQVLYMQQQERQRDCGKHSLSSPSKDCSPTFASMSSPELQEHIQHIQGQLKEAMQQRDSPSSKEGVASDSLKGEVKTGDHERQDIAKLRDELAAREVEVRELTSHLVRSKEREFALTREAQLADEKLRQAQEEKNQAQVQLEAAMQNSQGHEAMGSAMSAPSSPFGSPTSSWPRSARPPGVYSDYSPFPRAPEAEQVGSLKTRVRELEITLEEGKRDMIELLQQVDRKDRQIQELLAASFRGSTSSPQPPTVALHSDHILDRLHAPPPPLKAPTTPDVEATDTTGPTECDFPAGGKEDGMESQQGPSLYASISQGPSRHSSNSTSSYASPTSTSLPTTPMSNGFGYFQGVPDLYATSGNKERSPVIAESQNGEPQHFTIHGGVQGPVQIMSSTSYM